MLMMSKIKKNYSTFNNKFFILYADIKNNLLNKKIIKSLKKYNKGKNIYFHL